MCVSEKIQKKRSLELALRGIKNPVTQHKKKTMESSAESTDLAVKIIKKAKENTINLILQHDAERKRIYNSLLPEQRLIFDRYLELDYRIFNLNNILEEQYKYLENDKKRKRESSKK